MKTTNRGGRALRAFLALLILAACEQPTDRTSGTVAVQGILGAPQGGQKGRVLDLAAAKVSPDHATRRNIAWELLDGGTTGLSQEDLAEGRPVPPAAGLLQLRAVVAGGLGEGRDYTQSFAVTITEDFVAVTGITAPSTGAAGSPLALNASRVLPRDASVQTITWTLLDAGTTGVTPGALAGGSPVPKDPGTLKLRAVVAGGLGEGEDYTREHSIVITTPGAEPGKTLIGIRVASPPDITVYALNQPFDPAGLVMERVYEDQSSAAMDPSEYTLDQPDMSRPEPKRIRVSAGGNEAGFNIYVSSSDKVLSSISAAAPTNKVQTLGRAFDKTGLVVTGVYTDGSTQNLASYAAILGYDPKRRGSQAVSVRVNNKTTPVPDITSRIGAAATVSINAPIWNELVNMTPNAYKSVFIRGEAIGPENANIRLRVDPGGGEPSVDLSIGDGGITTEELAAIAGYNPDRIGKQTPVLSLDGRTFDLEVTVIDTEPEVWFDYGYMRHAGDPGGAGKGAGINEGKHYVKPGETLILAPVRYLVGYNADHGDAGARYDWTVSGGSWTTSGDGEFLHFTPSAAGTYSISVDVTGRNYVSGGSITKTASTEVVCFDNNPQPQSINLTLKNYSPGQYTEGGAGYDWSLGAAGGYKVWSVEHRETYKISGNAFDGWHEPGIVWAQEDRNGNGKPDETWYELKGGDDSDPSLKSKIVRRYAIRYFEPLGGSGGSTGTEYGHRLRDIYWTDSKGRSGCLPGGWPKEWGVTGDWVTYTCTLLRDSNKVDDNTGGVYPAVNYVDALGEIFSIRDAMDITGSPVTLTAVRFLKVHTAVLRYGTGVGDISTEMGYVPER